RAASREGYRLMSFDRKYIATAANGARITVREAGAGEDVLLFHCSAGSGKQWDGLSGLLGNQFHSIAPDLIGYGGSERWSGHGPLTLAEQARTMLATLDGDADGVHLVGHSCGGAVAMRAALELGARLRSLTLIEPSAFHLLRRGDPGEVGFWYEISDLAADVWHGARSGDAHGGMARFIDYWSGPGAWNDLRDDVRDRLAEQIGTVAIDFAVLFSETSPIADFARIEAPVLILQGSHSPAPSRRLCEMLNATLPNCQLRTIEGASHMSPLTHAAEVNAHIRDHLFLHGVAPCAAAA
ncbi:MAG: alpha/beta hydrolase, partial [Alphaproteobacteria bacterium]|nr:alpha/beta hydrolase [Alphaproteobacteria bacterium]